MLFFNLGTFSLDLNILMLCWDIVMLGCCYVGLFGTLVVWFCDPETQPF